MSSPFNLGSAAKIVPRVSKSDEAFAKDGVEFVWGADDVNVDELNDLFAKV